MNFEADNFLHLTFFARNASKLSCIVFVILVHTYNMFATLGINRLIKYGDNNFFTIVFLKFFSIPFNLLCLQHFSLFKFSYFQSQICIANQLKEKTKIHFSLFKDVCFFQQIEDYLLGCKFCLLQLLKLLFRGSFLTTRKSQTHPKITVAFVCQ